VHFTLRCLRVPPPDASAGDVQDHERRTPLDLCKAQIQSGVTSAYLNSCFDCGDSVPFACEWQAVKRLLEGVVSSAQRKAEEIGAALVAEEEAEERRKSAPGKKVRGGWRGGVEGAGWLRRRTDKRATRRCAEMRGEGRLPRRARRARRRRPRAAMRVARRQRRRRRRRRNRSRRQPVTGRWRCARAAAAAVAAAR
jgi:hypothetical protein